MSEDRLRAMELTHQDLRDKIEKLEKWNPQIEKNMSHCQRHTTEIGINKRHIEKLEKEVFDQTNKSRIDESLSKTDELEQRLEALKPMNNLELQTLRERCDTLKYGIAVERDKNGRIEVVIKILYSDVINYLNGIITKEEFISAGKVRLKQIEGEPSTDILSKQLDKLDTLYPLEKEEKEAKPIKCPKCKKENLKEIWAHEEHSPGAVKKWIDGMKCPKCGYIDFSELKEEQEAEPLKEIEIEFLKKYGWYQQIRKEQEQKDIAEFLKKILAFNYARNTEEQIIEIREWLEAKQREGKRK